MSYILVEDRDAGVLLLELRRKQRRKTLEDSGDGKRPAPENFESGVEGNLAIFQQRINSIEEALQAVPFDRSKSKGLGRIFLGAVVEALDLDTKETFFFEIYGKSFFAKRPENRLLFSSESPVFKSAFMGKSVGDTIVGFLNSSVNRTVRWRIEKIEYKKENGEGVEIHPSLID